MPIVQQGSINTTALVVPDLYVQIVPPQNLILNGVPTNVVGVSALHRGDRWSACDRRDHGRLRQELWSNRRAEV